MKNRSLFFIITLLFGMIVPLQALPSWDMWESWDDDAHYGDFDLDGSFGFPAAPSVASKVTEDTELSGRPKTLTDYFTEPLKTEKTNKASKKKDSEKTDKETRLEKQRAYVHFMDKLIVTVKHIERKVQSPIFPPDFKEFVLRHTQSIETIIDADGRIAESPVHFAAFFDASLKPLRKGIIEVVPKLEALEAAIDTYLKQASIMTTYDDQDTLTDTVTPTIKIETDHIASTYERRERMGYGFSSDITPLTFPSKKHGHHGFSSPRAQANLDHLEQLVRDAFVPPQDEAGKEDGKPSKKLSKTEKQKKEEPVEPYINAIGKRFGALFEDDSFKKVLDRERKEYERTHKEKAPYSSKWRSSGGYTPSSWGRSGYSAPYYGSGYGSSGYGRSGYGSGGYGDYGTYGNYGGYGSGWDSFGGDGYGKDTSHTPDSSDKKDDKGEKESKKGSGSKPNKSEALNQVETAKEELMKIFDAWNKALARSKDKHTAYKENATQLPAIRQEMHNLKSAYAKLDKEDKQKTSKEMMKKVYAPNLKNLLLTVPFVIERKETEEAFRDVITMLQVEDSTQLDVAGLANRAQVVTMLTALPDVAAGLKAQAEKTRSAHHMSVMKLAHQKITKANGCYPIDLGYNPFKDEPFVHEEETKAGKNRIEEEQAQERLKKEEEEKDKKEFTKFIELTDQLVKFIKLQRVQVETLLQNTHTDAGDIRKAYSDFVSQSIGLCSTTFPKIHLALQDDIKPEDQVRLVALFMQSALKELYPLLTFQPRPILDRNDKKDEGTLLGYFAGLINRYLVRHRTAYEQLQKDIARDVVQQPGMLHDLLHLEGALAEAQQTPQCLTLRAISEARDWNQGDQNRLAHAQEAIRLMKTILKINHNDVSTAEQAVIGYTAQPQTHTIDDVAQAVSQAATHLDYTEITKVIPPHLEAMKRSIQEVHRRAEAHMTLFQIQDIPWLARTIAALNQQNMETIKDAYDHLGYQLTIQQRIATMRQTIEPLFQGAAVITDDHIEDIMRYCAQRGSDLEIALQQYITADKALELLLWLTHRDQHGAYDHYQTHYGATLIQNAHQNQHAGIGVQEALDRALALDPQSLYGFIWNNLRSYIDHTFETLRELVPGFPQDSSGYRLLLQ